MLIPFLLVIRIFASDMHLPPQIQPDDSMDFEEFMESQDPVRGKE